MTSILINNLPGFVFCRNKQLVSQYCNAAYAAYLGLKNASDFKEIKYEEVSNSHVAEYAQLYEEQDRKVINSMAKMSVLALDPRSQSEPMFMYGCKVPLLDKKGILKGVLGQAFILDKTYFAGLHKLIQAKNQKLVKTTYEIQDYVDYGLSPREAECFFYLLRGYSAKAIGRKLLLSQKTVESYIALVKQKLDCSSKTQLIEKGFDLGLIYIIPNKLMNWEVKYRADVA